VTQLFISDLHLDASRPEAIDAFEQLLRTEARDAERLYILGDLFEAWIGDDDPNPVGKRVASALQDLHRSGTSCYFIAGNRDFLIRRGFANAAGIHLLPEFALTEINGERVLLTHGDLLCTDDVKYQRARKVLHNPLVQALYLALPLKTRLNIAERMRDKSRSENQAKEEYIMDVSQACVELCMRKYDVSTLIHGHTHRPDVHRFEVDGEASTRIVLGDWYEQGSILRWTDTDFSLDGLSFDIAQ